MNREKAIQILKRCEAESYCSHYKRHHCCIGCGQREALDLAIEALGQTVSKDCISRADTIKAMCAECTQEGYDECREDCTEVAVLKSMPSVTPPKKVVAQINIDTEELIERIKEEYEITNKVGEWIYGNGHGECSVCKHERQYGWDNYCGNCGAKMRGCRNE